LRIASSVRPGRQRPELRLFCLEQIDGVVIESPTFVAFLAESWNGKTYKDPTLFTIRSLDGQPIRSSKKARIYHGFGQDNLLLGPSELQIAREKTLAPGSGAVTP
jgi:hypothetical protein